MTDKEWFNFLAEIFEDEEEYEEEYPYTDIVKRPISQLIAEIPEGELESALTICKMLCPKNEADPTLSITDQLIHYFKFLNEAITSYAYYAFEGDYETFWASQLLWLDNFDVLPNASAILKQYSYAKGPFWFFLTEWYFPQREVLGGDDVSSGIQVEYIFE